MIARVLAWSLVGLTAYAVLNFGGSVVGPWMGLVSPAPAVINHLPPLPPGCKEKGC